MKRFLVLFFAQSLAGLLWSQKTVAEENLDKTRSALLGKWEVLRSGSQAEAKKLRIVGDYFEFTNIETYSKPVHPSLRAHYKITGNWYGLGSTATNKDQFPMLKGDASYDPTTSTWSFGFQIELPEDKPGAKRIVNKSGLVRGTEMMISSYFVDAQGDPYSAFEVGVKLPETKDK